jgi:hypothetical protein
VCAWNGRGILPISRSSTVSLRSIFGAMK